MTISGKTDIFFFSGTGNARQIALWLSEFAGENHILCRLHDISKTDTLSMEAVDPESLIIIISPIHGFNYPKITLSFIRHFPKGKNNVVLMNTRGGLRIGKFVTPGLTGIAFFLASLWLKGKGYQIKGTIPFDMPSNWISLHPALRAAGVKFLHQKNYDRVRIHAGKIFSGKSDFKSLSEIVQDILIFPVSIGYYLIGRFVLAKSFYANHTCDNCGICIQGCPVKAIKTVQNKPFWTLKCESCMKCMNSCPKRSIETAHALIIAVSFITSASLSLLSERYLSGFLFSGTLRSVIDSIGFLGVMIVMYRLQHLLLANQKIGRLISLLSVTHYKFWGRYRSIPDRKWR
jgi:Pyruvate/2-oxoacid:ferredoxin oxidoreductase delta subunit